MTIGIVEFEAAKADFWLGNRWVATQSILGEFFLDGINIRDDHQQQRLFDVACTVLAEVSDQRPATHAGISRKVILKPVNPVFVEPKHVAVKVDAHLGIFDSENRRESRPAFCHVFAPCVSIRIPLNTTS